MDPKLLTCGSALADQLMKITIFSNTTVTLTSTDYNTERVMFTFHLEAMRSLLVTREAGLALKEV